MSRGGDMLKKIRDVERSTNYVQKRKKQKQKAAEEPMVNIGVS
jgi:hypothetical protein